MRLVRTLTIVTLSVGLAALLVFAVVWSANPYLFEKRSPSVVVTGITRTINYADEGPGNLSVRPMFGCPVCPLIIEAGSSAVVPIWIGWSNMSAGFTAYFNWSLHSPYPFGDVYCANAAFLPIGSQLNYCNESNQAGPYGGGEFAFAITISIPFQYTGLPPAANITFNMTATLVGQPWASS
jgi:hypothetical protein